MKSLYLFFCFLLCTPIFAQTEKKFEQANNYYKNQQFEQAAKGYEELSGVDSKEIYFNLGNAYYQLNQVGPSIYAYEKALQIDPGFAAAKQNLQLAEKRKIDQFQMQKNLSTRDLWHQTIGFFSSAQWAISAVLLMVLGVLSFSLFYFNDASFLKKSGFTLMCVCFFLGVISTIAAYTEKAYEMQKRYAIVMLNETPVKTEPRLTSKNAKIINEGTKLFVYETTTKWAKVALPDASIGWVSLENIKEL